MSPVLDKLLDKTLDNNNIDKSKDTGLNDDIKEDDFLSLDELNDFLSVNESDLDSEVTKEASKTSDLEEDKISDVNVDSDHKNTQCPATDDEMDPFDDFDDGDDDDFSFTPKKKVVSENKKQRIKPKMYYAGGGIQ